MNAAEPLQGALEAVAAQAARLRNDLRLPWPEVVRSSVLRLRLGASGDKLLPVAAVVGGASSGKSTVFNNLLGGHLASRVTAKGHATLGPILAVHEKHRPVVEQLLSADRFLPGHRRIAAQLDDNVSGQPDALIVVYHTVGALGEVFLFDLPDFTSESARKEGDVTLSLLPWFDRLVIVVDHERWFDRQSISMLRAASARVGQERFVLFNRTREGSLGEHDRAALDAQAERLGASGMSVLAFRRGRGFCRFPPGVLDQAIGFLQESGPDRTPVLTAHVAEAARQVLNQNEERLARASMLRESVRAAVERSLPTPRDCMTALMTPAERQEVEPLARLLRLDETKKWLSAQRRRLETMLRQVPVLGAVLERPGNSDATASNIATDRITIARSYYESVAGRSANDLQRSLTGSAFWDELRRWTGLEPAAPEFAWDPADRHAVESAARAFDTAIVAWLEKVEGECRGLAPSIKGGAGVAALGLAIVLLAAPGPIAALSLVAAKGAVAGALTQLVAAAGAGAVLGKPLGRLGRLVQERLVGSAELTAVQSAAGRFRGLLEAAVGRLADSAVDEATALTMPRNDPLVEALEALCRAHEDGP